MKRNQYHQNMCHIEMIARLCRKLCYALTVLLITIWLAGCHAHNTRQHQPVPRWMYEIPQGTETWYAIGEAPLTVMDRTDSLNAMDIAVNRLATSIRTHIRYGAAEKSTGSGATGVDFVVLETDEDLVARVRHDARVVAHFQTGNMYHLLLGWGVSPRLSEYHAEPVIHNTRSSQPEWIARIPDDDTFVYNWGASGRSGTLGWEFAERQARAQLAALSLVNISWGKTDIDTDLSSFSTILSNHHGALEQVDTRVVSRWRDKHGSCYTLMRQQKP